MLVEAHDGEFVYIDIEELDGPVSASGEELVLVDLGPGEVVLGIVGVEASEAGSASC